MSQSDEQPSDGGGFLTGRLLVAMPGIGDPRFEHAVILICLHNEEHAMGVRVNRPVDGMTVAGVLNRLGVKGDARNPTQEVLNGGPLSAVSSQGSLRCSKLARRLAQVWSRT